MTHCYRCNRRIAKPAGTITVGGDVFEFGPKCFRMVTASEPIKRLAPKVIRVDQPSLFEGEFYMLEQADKHRATLETKIGELL